MKPNRILPLLLLLLIPVNALALGFETREELRSAYAALGDPRDRVLFEQEPGITAPYSAGRLSEESVADAMGYLGLIRRLAGLSSVTTDELYMLRAQSAAVLSAANDVLSHTPSRPSDMPTDFFETASAGCGSSNIARLGWTRPSILRDAVSWFVRDDGEGNLDALGHRRWILNPTMAATGLGLAVSASGSSYAALYAHDLGNTQAEWELVCWPAEGVFPVELMHTDLAWSVSLNPEVYTWQAGDVRVTLTEPTLGITRTLQPGEDSEAGRCTLNAGRYGSGPCLSFRPELSGEDFTDYLQNQHWTVRIEGLYRYGEPVTPEYTVDMVSLYAQDVASVELDRLQAELAVGETLALSATVIPQYADDLTLSWYSTDAGIATVDGNGLVRAVAAGSCEIVAQSVNGREDRCVLTIE